jgi:hypothetical protein
MCWEKLWGICSGLVWVIFGDILGTVLGKVKYVWDWFGECFGDILGTMLDKFWEIF